MGGMKKREESNTEKEWRRKKICGEYKGKGDRRNAQRNTFGNQVEFGL